MPPSTIVLTAHGSRDPRAAGTVRDIASAVAAARPGQPVRAAFLDFDSPGLGEVLADEAAAGRRSIVAPLLLTPAYHARFDVPAIVDVARSHGADVEIAASLGGPGGCELLAAALESRLRSASNGGDGVDAVVVGAAGSRDKRAIAVVDEIADALQQRLGIPCRPGYASGVGEPVRDAALALRRDGSRQVGLAMCFVAPGVLPERATAAARDLGITTIAPPLGDASALVELTLGRVDALALTPTR